MSDTNNLNDDFDNRSDDAKRASREFTDGTNRDSRQFSENVKRESREFEHDVDKVMADGKNVALIAHLTLIGWIIALVMNNNTKSEFASFYIRQMLGLMIIAFVLSFIPIIGWILNIGLLVLWVISLMGAFNGERKLTPVVGVYFQDWFKSL